VLLTAADLCHQMTARAPFRRDGWIFELKHDGFRALVRKDKTGVQLLSRSGRGMETPFPEVVAAVAKLPGDIVFDAELVVPTAEKRTDFDELRRRALLQRPCAIEQAAVRRPAVLVVFDLLECDGEDLRRLPLLSRRDGVYCFGAPVPGIQLIEHIETHGEALFRVVVEHDHEGIVAKRLDAPYRAGRQSHWLKIKNRDYSRREAVEWRP
jgi:bifunctional non-homologous end joining protein LigD